MFHRAPRWATILERQPGWAANSPEKKWEHADDGAWVLHLRDAVFQNGAPVTSADVAWTIQQVAGEKSTAYLRAEMQRIAKIETPDAKTIRLVTKEPIATLPYLLASYFRADTREGFHLGGQSAGYRRGAVPAGPTRNAVSRWNSRRSISSTGPVCRS